MKVSEKCVDKMISGQIIESKDRDIYVYSVNAVFEIGCNLLVSILLGIVLNRFVETLFFLVLLMIMRSLVGGCHAKNGIVCFVLSLLVLFLGVELPAVLLEVPSYILVILCLGLSTCVYLLSPVDCLERPLSNERKKQIKKWIAYAIVGVSLISFILIYYHSYQYSYEIILIYTYLIIVNLIEIYRKKRKNIS